MACRIPQARNEGKRPQRRSYLCSLLCTFLRTTVQVGIILNKLFCHTQAQQLKKHIPDTIQIVEQIRALKRK